MKNHKYHGNSCWENCEALLFDKDGTLVNFKLMWLNWCHEMIEVLKNDYNPEAVESCLSVWGVDLALGRIEPDGFLAIGSREELQQSLADRMKDAGLCEAGPEEAIWKAMHCAYRSVEEKKLVQPIDGIPETIAELHRRGYKLAVVTTDDTVKAEENLLTIGLSEYFSTVIGCDRVKHCKPAPDLVFEACRLLNVESSRCAVIGDTAADMLMGKAASTACNIGVASGVTSPEALSVHADLVLNSVADMI